MGPEGWLMADQEFASGLVCGPEGVHGGKPAHARPCDLPIAISNLDGVDRARRIDPGAIREKVLADALSSRHGFFPLLVNLFFKGS
jgi:hypothetical protein